MFWVLYQVLQTEQNSYQCFKFDSAGFSAGYCFYSIIQAGTKKVLAFTVCTKDMAPYSAKMGRLKNQGFGTVFDFYRSRFGSSVLKWIGKRIRISFARTGIKFNFILIYFWLIFNNLKYCTKYRSLQLKFIRWKKVFRFFLPSKLRLFWVCRSGSRFLYKLWIRIQLLREYWLKTDPDPIRIRIWNPE